MNPSLASSGSSSPRRPWLAATLAALLALALLATVPVASRPAAAQAAAPPADLPLDSLIYNVSESAAPSDSPSIATEGDDTYVAWREGDRVAFRAIRDRGHTEDALLLLDAEGGSGRLTFEQPGLAAAGDDVYVTWSKGTRDPEASSPRTVWEVFVAVSHDRGATFAPAEQLSGVGGDFAYHPKVAATEEVAGIVWDEPSGLKVATLDVTSRLPWGIYPLGGDAYNSDYAVGAAGDVVHAVWSDSGSAGGGVRARRATDGGTRLQAITEVAGPDHGADFPSIDVDGSTVAVGWRETNSEDSLPIQMWVATSADGGASFATTLVGDVGTSCTCGGPLVAVGVGRVFAVYDGQRTVEPRPGEAPEPPKGILQAVIEGGTLLSVTPVGGAPIIGRPTDLVVTNAAVFVTYQRTDPETYRLEVHHGARRHGSGDWALRRVWDASAGFGYDSQIAPIGEGDYIVAFTSLDRESGLQEILVAPGNYATEQDLAVLEVGIVQGPERAERLAAGHLTAARAVLRNTFFRPTPVTVHWELRNGDLSSGGALVEHDQTLVLQPGNREVWFTPPPEYRPAAGEVRLEVGIDTAHAYQEDDEANNDLDLTLPVVETRPLDVLYVPLTSEGATVACADLQLVEANANAYLDAVYPIDDRESLSGSSCTSSIEVDAGPLGRKRNLAGVIADVEPQVEHLSELWDAIVVVTPDGWLQANVEEVAGGGQGLSDIGSRPGVVFVEQTAYSGWVTAHEIAHDRGWVIGAHDDGTHHTKDLGAPGYWVERAQDVDLYDFMQASGPSGGTLARWVGPPTWEHLVDGLSVPSILHAAAGPSQSLVVTGALTDAGTVESPHLERLDLAPTVGLGAPGDLEVLLLDAAGIELARTALPLGQASHGGDAGARLFSGRVPDVAGTATVVLRAAGQEVFRRTRSATAPTVALTAPAGATTAVPGGQVELAWTAADADGDVLTTRVDVTTDDGTSWRPVRSKIVGSTLSAPLTPELNATLRYRVTVADGWDTVSVVGEPVTVTPPTANGRIAYTSAEPIPGGAYGTTTIRSVAADGSDERPLASLTYDGGSAMPLREPAYSPDGSLVAFSAAGEELVVVGSDGSGLRRLGMKAAFSGGPRRPDGTEARSFFFCPTWSPDGSQLAFVAVGDGLGGTDVFGERLMVVDADGSDPREVLDEAAMAGPAFNCSEASGGLSWSSDDRIWFWGSTEYRSRDLLLETVRPDGTGRTLVHRVPGALSGGPAPWSFDVSGDGTQLAYVYGNSPDLEIFVVPTAGGTARQVTTLPNNSVENLRVDRVEWSPDGRFLAAATTDNVPRLQAQRIEAVDVLSGERRVVVGGSPARRNPAWQPVPPAPPAPGAPQVQARLAPPAPAVEGAAVTLDASASTAEAGPATFAWDLDGDGRFDDATGGVATATFVDEGGYDVAVQVTDALGQVAVARTQAVVGNAAPVTGAASAAERGGAVHVSVEVTDPGADELTATLDWGDGEDTPVILARSAGGWLVLASRAVAGVGPEVTVTVSDGDGGTATATLPVAAVTNQAPTLGGGTAEVERGSLADIVLDATDPDGDPLELRLVDGPHSGSVELGEVHPLGQARLVYLPAPGFAGTDTFTVVVSDGTAESAPATVGVTVTGGPEDTTAPSVQIESPADGGVILLGQPVTVAYRCDDDVAVASCTGDQPVGTLVDTTQPGLRTFHVTATDEAGNTTTATASYRVAYRFEGFDAPVGSDVVNAAAGGRTIPIKWRLSAHSGPVGDASAIVELSSQPVGCGDGQVTGPAQPATGQPGLRYQDAGRWHFNWTTSRAWAGTCRLFTLALADGTHHSALFRFR